MNIDTAIVKNISKHYQFLLYPNEGPIPVFEKDGNTYKQVRLVSIEKAIIANCEELTAGYVETSIGDESLYLNTSSLRLITNKTPELYIGKLNDKLATWEEKVEAEYKQKSDETEVIFRRLDNKHARSEEFSYTVKNETITKIQPISRSSGIEESAILIGYAFLLVSAWLLVALFRRVFKNTKSR